MSSPVTESIQKRLKYIDNSLPKYIQLSQAILQTIKYLPIPTHGQIPSSRQLAIVTKWHRKTIIAALDNLIQEGFIYAIPNKGYYVSENLLLQKSLKKQQLYEDAQLDEAIQIYNLEKHNFKIYNKHVAGKNAITSFWNVPQVFSKIQYKKFFSTLNSIINKPVYLNKLYVQSTFVDNSFTEIFQSWINKNSTIQIQVQDIYLHTNILSIMNSLIEQLWQKNDSVIISPNCPVSLFNALKQYGIKYQILPISNQRIDIKKLEVLQQQYIIRGIIIDNNNGIPYFEPLNNIEKIQLIQLAKQQKIPIVEISLNQVNTAYEPILAIDDTGSSIYVQDYQFYLPANHNIVFVLAHPTIINNIKHNSYLSDNFVNNVTLLTIQQLIKSNDWHRLLNKQSSLLLHIKKEQKLLFANKICFTQQNKIYWLEDDAIALKNTLVALNELGVVIEKSNIISNKQLHAFLLHFNEKNYLDIMGILQKLV